MRLEMFHRAEADGAHSCLTLKMTLGTEIFLSVCESLHSLWL